MSIFYAVLTTLPSAAKAREYLAWLHDGHLAAVLAGGAQSAAAVELDPQPALPPDAVQVLTHYVFSSREAFAVYERDHAPALRAEGRQKFGPDQGVTMQRMLGKIVE